MYTNTDLELFKARSALEAFLGHSEGKGWFAFPHFADKCMKMVSVPGDLLLAVLKTLLAGLALACCETSDRRWEGSHSLTTVSPLSPQ